MVKKASFFCSLYLDSNELFNVEKLDEIFKTKRKKNIKKSDYSWGIDNGGYKDYFSLKEAVADFFELIEGKISDINNACKTLKLDRPLFIFEITVYDNCFPELCLDGEIMDVIHALDADIHFNISNEMSSES
ncbi:MAG: DUF4279 domain-containing protein [Candidatus Borkfalkiaceae bacterium]|nr:DUF4279 domain-containing protein [Christensenellaceae bacterium]